MREKKNTDITAVYVVDDEFKIVSFNDVLGKIYPDLKEGEFCYEQLCHEQAPCKNCPIVHRDENGTIFYNQWLQQWIDVKVGTLPWPGKGICHVLTAKNFMGEESRLMSDLSAKERNQEKDGLTCLYHNTAFFAHGEEYLRKCEKEQQCLIAIDIEHFKLFNEWYGRAAGDDFLISMGESLSKIQEIWGGVAGYMGGDNFALVLPYKKGLIYYIQNNLSVNVKKFGDNAGFLPIFGIYLIEDREISMETMYDRATIALAQAKTDYSGRLCYFQPSMIEKMEEEQHLLSKIQHAFSRKEFTFYLQPQYNVKNGKIIGAEALMRWETGQRETISSGKLLPFLEKNRFIMNLDKFIWEEVCQILRKWLNQGIRPVPISVNVSRIDIYSLDVAEYFKMLMRKYQLRPDYIKIEITESVYVEEFEIVTKAVMDLKKAGFQVLMDDFGSGYSSLNMLKNMNVDILKIDMRFLHFDTDNMEKGINILESVISMARLLNLPIIVEGVETEAQLLIIQKMGCRYVQGYYYSKPLPKTRFEEMMRNRKLLDYDGFHSAAMLMSRDEKSTSSLEKEVQSMDLLLKYLPDNIFIFRKKGDVSEYQVLANGISKKNGFTLKEYEQQLNDRIFAGHITLEDQNRIQREMREAGKKQEDYHTILSFNNEEKEKVWVSIDCYYIGEKDARYMCIVRDISEAKSQEYQLDLYRKKLEKILDISGINSWEWDIRNNKLLIMNAKKNSRLKKIYPQLGEERVVISDFPQCFLRQSGFMEQHKQRFLEWLDDVYTGKVTELNDEKFLFTGEEGEIVWISVQGEIIYDENSAPVRMFGSFVDITEEKRQELRLTAMAETDALTGLYNRHRAVPEIKKYLEENQDETSALIMIDLDNLKQANDTFGHAYGDMMILTMAKRIKNHFRKEDIVSRFGGDEFLILCKNITREILERKLKELVQPVVVSSDNPDLSGKFTLSAGYVMIEGNEETLDELYQKADKAMFDAKKRGKSNFAEYQQE